MVKGETKAFTQENRMGHRIRLLYRGRCDRRVVIQELLEIELNDYFEDSDLECAVHDWTWM